MWRDSTGLPYNTPKFNDRMAHPSFRTHLLLSLLLALLLASLPAPAGAVGTDDFLPLEEFIAAVHNGDADSLRGIYVPGVLASPIVPQPAAQPWFVSDVENTLTQFALAGDFGSIGLLAHNTLAGKDFARLSEGQAFLLVYGDGRTESFIVSERRRYQALSPEDTRSRFADLDHGGTLSAARLFREVYDQPGRVVLQTCIEQQDEPSWGRLFIIAAPYENGPAIRSDLFE